MNLLLQKHNIQQQHFLMNKKKLLVYDTSRGVAAEIRKNIAKDYETYYSFKKINDASIRLEDFFAAIIIVNDVDDLLKIEALSSKINNIMVSTSLKKESFIFPNLSNVTIFDLKLKRKELILFLKNKLKTFELG